MLGSLHLDGGLLPAFLQKSPWGWQYWSSALNGFSVSCCKVQEYLGAGAAMVVVDAAELLHAKAAWATHAANQLMADVGAQRLLFDADSDPKVTGKCLLAICFTDPYCAAAGALAMPLQTWMLLDFCHELQVTAGSPGQQHVAISAK